MKEDELAYGQYLHDEDEARKRKEKLALWYNYAVTLTSGVGIVVLINLVMQEDMPTNVAFEAGIGTGALLIVWLAGMMSMLKVIEAKVKEKREVKKCR